MHTIPLPGTSVKLSRLAFGTASLHHLSSSRRRTDLLRAALDQGITHFDTSPYYGDGIGERALAALGAAGTVATKVGLYPRGGAHASWFRATARRALGRLWPRMTRPLVDFSVARARRSLDDSLRRLERERVDILWIHEPQSALLNTEEWYRWLDGERDRVGAIGLAGEPDRLLALAASGNPFARVLQTRDSVERREADALRFAGHVPLITYGHLSTRSPHRPVADVLRDARVMFPMSVLLLSTRRPTRIDEWTALMDAAPSAPEPA